MNGLATYLSARLSGKTPLEIVFWRDMLMVGSIVNVAATAAAFALIAAGYPAWAGLTVNFAPVPYNAFLLVSVWKAAEREGGPAAKTANYVGALWFLIMLAL